jgi:exonuclease SbcD
VHYSGSPLAVDFGEQENKSVVCLVSATPGTPARVTDIPVTSGRRLRTVHGTLDELEARKDSFGEDYLRVYVQEPVRAGLRDAAAEILPHALEIRVDPEFAAAADEDSGRGKRKPAAARTPAQLFAEYCEQRQVADPRVAALFAELHEEATAAGPALAGEG